MLIHINYDFMGWNEYINTERRNKYQANKVKQEEKAVVVFGVKERYKGNYPVTLTIRPHYQHKKRDLDNYRMKGLIDGLVSAGVIENDNLTKINKIILEPIFDGKTGVDIEITESTSKYTLADYVSELTDEQKEQIKEYIRKIEDEG